MSCRAAHFRPRARGGDGGGAGAPRWPSDVDAPAPQGSRASAGYAEDVHAREALLDEAAAVSRHRDGDARARLRSDARDEHHGREADDHGDEGVRDALPCSTSGSAQVASSARRGSSETVRRGKIAPFGCSTSLWPLPEHVLPRGRRRLATEARTHHLAIGAWNSGGHL